MSIDVTTDFPGKTWSDRQCAKADINVIDVRRIGRGRPELVPDLPGGASRFLQRTEGSTATFISGTRTVRHDKLPGAGGPAGAGC